VRTPRPLAEVERQHILKVVKVCKNLNVAAKALEVPLRTLYRRLHEYGSYESFSKRRRVDAAKDHRVLAALKVVGLEMARAERGI
jgi:hypothetical protein